VVNGIVIRGRDQVMLKVTVAEIERDARINSPDRAGIRRLPPVPAGPGSPIRTPAPAIRRSTAAVCVDTTIDLNFVRRSV
jgi:hypothetical protein